MKKKYLFPEISIDEIELEGMIALSTMEGDADPNGEVLSREGNMWDDDAAQDEVLF